MQVAWVETYLLIPWATVESAGVLIPPEGYGHYQTSARAHGAKEGKEG
jgi:hypothetical protein